MEKNIYSKIKDYKIIVLIMLSLISVVLSPTNCSAFEINKNGKFIVLKQMIEPRYYSSATLLQDGRVLITGGIVAYNKVPHTKIVMGKKVTLYLEEIVITDTAEFYNPKTRIFTKAGKMTSPRAFHSSVLLKDGKVLITGGDTARCEPTNSAEIYDPNTGVFSKINSMNVPLSSHTMFLLPDGRVFIPSSSKKPQFFYPDKNIFIETKTCIDKKRPSNAILMDDGRVFLFTLGTKNANDPPNQIFNPIDETYTPLKTVLSNHYCGVALNISNGKCLIVGGLYRGWNKGLDIYAPTQDTIIEGAVFPDYKGIEEQSAVPLDNNKVLLVGGLVSKGHYNADFQKSIKRAYLYDIKNDKFIILPNLKYARVRPKLIKLKDGNVLILNNVPFYDKAKIKMPELYIYK